MLSADWTTRYALLDDEERAGMTYAVELLFNLLENKRGCAVILADTDGAGELTAVALGNSALVVPMLTATTELHTQMLEAVTSGQLQ